MKRFQTACALLLSVPLIGSFVNHTMKLVDPLPDDGSPGAEMWKLIRGEGLMDWLAAGHLALGLMLLLARTRFAAALLQLPITLGIVGFNVLMFPAGVPMALAMLALNLGALASPAEAKRLIRPLES